MFLDRLGDYFFDYTGHDYGAWRVTMPESAVFLSIIIPVYHVSEELLNRCLNSIKMLSEMAIEVIIVADGHEIMQHEHPAIQELISNLPFHVRLYETEHQGVSAARNYGLEKVTGEWVAFLDADDYLDAEICKVVARQDVLAEADLVIMDYDI